MAEVSAYTVALELAVLRHMLRLGRRWGYLDEVPEIEMPKKPEGRQRYLDEGEITRLLDACRASRNPHLATIVTIAIDTGAEERSSGSRGSASTWRVPGYALRHQERPAARRADQPGGL
jgi:integrase